MYPIVHPLARPNTDTVNTRHLVEIKHIWLLFTVQPQCYCLNYNSCTVLILGKEQINLTLNINIVVVVLKQEQQNCYITIPYTKAHSISWGGRIKALMPKKSEEEKIFTKIQRKNERIFFCSCLLCHIFFGCLWCVCLCFGWLCSGCLCFGCLCCGCLCCGCLHSGSVCYDHQSVRIIPAIPNSSIQSLTRSPSSLGKG